MVAAAAEAAAATAKLCRLQTADGSACMRRWVQTTDVSPSCDKKSFNVNYLRFSVNDAKEKRINSSRCILFSFYSMPLKKS